MSDDVVCTVEVDDRGRLRLPAAVRKALDIEAGGLVQISIKRLKPLS